VTLSQGSNGANKTEVAPEPWLGDIATRPPVGLPKFLAVPNHVLRAPWCTSAMAVVCAAYLYRQRYDEVLDVRTVRRWTNLSRSSAYRLLKEFRARLDTLGPEQMFGPKTGPGAGWVRVLPEDIHAVGSARAIVLGLLRRWGERKDVKKARNGSVEVYANDLATASGLHERTVRKILDELSTGKHRDIKPENEILYLARFEVLQKRGRANFIRLLSKSEQTDRLNRLQREQQQRAERGRANERSKNEPQRKGATAERAKAQDDDHGEWAIKAFQDRQKVSAALTAVTTFLKRCSNR
jgi:hypothetical protein